MDKATLNIEERKNIGGGKVSRLRSDGYIPGVVYGHGMESIATQVKESDFKEFLSKYGKNSVFTTEFAAEHDLSILIKDIQYHPYQHHVMHVDFQKVALDEMIHAEVPVRVIGGEWIEKAGSVIIHQHNEVVVECLPQDVPKYINVDITGRTQGYTVTAGQLKLPQGVILTSEPDDLILSITNSKLGLQVNKADEDVAPVGEEGNVQPKRI